MTEKALNVASMEDLKTKAPGTEVFGNPGAWVLLGKASNTEQGWMKSTKAMQTPVGVLIQTSTEKRNPDGSWSICDALTEVRGAALRQVNGNHWEFSTDAGASKVRTALAAMKSCILSGEPWTQDMQSALDTANHELLAIEALGSKQ
jgi:hypothetical protein